MSWNHRVLASEAFHLNGEPEIIFSIHEVYYDNGFIANPAKVSVDNLESMEWQSNRMKECMKKLILWGDDRFPQ